MLIRKLANGLLAIKPPSEVLNDFEEASKVPGFSPMNKNRM